MNTIVLIIVSLVILAFLLIVGVLYLIQSKRDKDIKKQLEKLEIEKNKDKDKSSFFIKNLLKNQQSTPPSKSIRGNT